MSSCERAAGESSFGAKTHGANTSDLLPLYLFEFFISV